MGAEQIYMQFKGIVNDTLVKRTIEERARQDRERNGHQDGYSGDWQCVDSIKRVQGTFKNKDAALEYIEKHCEKWGPAIVVQYLTNDLNEPTIKTIVSAIVPC